jgi:hypothetical protein
MHDTDTSSLAGSIYLEVDETTDVTIYFAASQYFDGDTSN